MASEFEDELIALDARVEKAQKAAEGLVTGLKRVRRAAQAGQTSDIVKGLEGLDARLADAQSATTRSFRRMAFRHVGVHG